MTNHRPFKFRFYDKEYSQWRELPDLIGTYQVVSFRTYGDPFGIRHFLCSEAQAKIISGDLIIQQFTGLTDKTGREIYEGDIIKWDKRALTKTGNSISFESGAFVIDGVGTLFEYTTLTNPNMVDGYVVIGNVFENPELLS